MPAVFLQQISQIMIKFNLLQERIVHLLGLLTVKPFKSHCQAKDAFGSKN
jgi:hypothetical protein